MTDPITGAWEAQRAAMGAFIRSQRELANMSLREMSRLTKVSNAYLSQVERGLHDPTLRVLQRIGEALDVSVQEIIDRGTDLAAQAASSDDPEAGGRAQVAGAILADPNLSENEKQALLAVYRSYLAGHEPRGDQSQV